MNVNVYTDGGSRGNPGPSGFGLVIYDDQNNIIYQESTFLGIKTNNEAEYSGIISAIKWVEQNFSKLNIDQVTFFADSQLLIRQLQGVYKVKSPNLVPLFQQAKKTLNQMNLNYQFNDIRREYNQLADELANQAMDRGF